MMRRRMMMGRGLPYDAEVEYLESTGTQWINLPVSVVSGNYFGVEICFILLTTSSKKNIWNSNVTDAFKSTTHQYNSTSKQMLFTSHVGGNASGGGWTTIYGEVIDCIVSTTKVQTRVVRRSITDFTNLKLLDINFNCKLMSFKVVHKGSVIYDLIPVRVGNVGYMYDKVSRQLFGNAGTGQFILGPDKMGGS